MGEKNFEDLPKTKYEYNPAHPIGTCGDCGGEMIYNVPRLGINGGFIHKETGQLLCGPYQPIQFTTNTQTN